MSPNKKGKKKKKKSSSPSKKNEATNNWMVGSQPTTHQTRLKETLNLWEVNHPTPFSGSNEEDTEFLRNVFPPTHKEHIVQYKELSQQEPMFCFIKKQDERTHNIIVATLYADKLQPADRYITISQLVMMLLKNSHCLQYKVLRPPNLANNEQ